MRARVRVLAPAKLNLGLRVLGRRPDGYHEIETVFLPLLLFDELELEPADGATVQIETDHPALPADASNLAARGAEAARAALGVREGVRIALRKRIPVAAGLGGGSSDAAAALLGVETLVGRGIPPAERRALARSLGADVPFFLAPRPAIGRGIGEEIEPIPGVPEMWWVLVCFPFQVSTAEVYRAVDVELTHLRPPSSIAALLGPSGVRSSPENDLEAITARRHPEVQAARRALERAGALVTGMSGSGPTVYGRFDGRETAEGGCRRMEPPAGAWMIVTSSPASDTDDWGWGVAKR